MKTLHLSIIVLAGIIVISMTSIGVFIEKINENPQYPYAKITLNGIKGNYTINELISFSLTVEGYGSGCGDTKVTITKENDSHYKSPEWDMEPQCVAFTEPHNFKFNTLPTNISMNQAGNYILTALFDDSITHNHAETGRRISVISPNNTSIQDTGIIHGIANVTNTNFSINYTIDSGAVLGMEYDKQTKSVMASVKTTSKGVFTVTLPRALVDSVLPNGKDDRYVVLINDTESNYNETNTTAINRTLAIPISQGTSTIEILGEYLI